MVYDCFTFFNELDLLEIRLRELSPVVDKFVIVESTRTFQKKIKSLYYRDNEARFAEFHDKIIHVVVEDHPTFFTHWRVPRTWHFENHQREQILRGLTSANDDDTILISDVDEFPRPDKILEYKNSTGIKVFEQFLCFYYVNNICTFLNVGLADELVPARLNHHGFGFWRGTVMLAKKDITTIKEARLFRDLPDDEVTVIPEGGWHFSYLGGVEKIIEKFESFSHNEYNTKEFKNPEAIRKAVNEGRSLFDRHTRFKRVDIKDPRYPFPRPLLQQPDRYSHLIL
jgi:beta-1,4-mannosyl-glycoprotein beta-1,4-N-acetylglucosaminyltransferase